MSHDITLTVDYHDRICVIRRRDQATGREQLFSNVATTPEGINQVVDRARRDLDPRGHVLWIQESTTGWARVQGLLGTRAGFLLANVVQMPLPPKARRRKTDKVDTARIQREYLNGELPLAYQPTAAWRQLRRLVAFREGLVSRRTALRNWINRFLAHETWFDRTGLWSPPGQRRLRDVLPGLPPTDARIIGLKLEELARIEEQLAAVLVEFGSFYRGSPEAQRLDAIAGIDVVAAVSIVARIGAVDRFPTVDRLIAFAGLAPGVQQSDQTRRDGRIGGGGTDRHLRHYLIEASVWARKLPRYQATYERIKKRRGPKVGRVVVARMLLRSIFKVLRDGVDFDPALTTETTTASAAD